MVNSEQNGEKLYNLAMDLFLKTGHTDTSEPEIINHSPEQFYYFDNESNSILSSEQRDLFHFFDNISRLFTFNDCVFYSINLNTRKSDRSHKANDIHTIIHQITETTGTICIFQFEDEIMLSFMGFDYDCILSDWYPIEDDYEELAQKLDIANISLETERDYFTDLIYLLARNYYIEEQPVTFELIPTYYYAEYNLDPITKEEQTEYINNILNLPQIKYGDDYVEYNKDFKKEINENLDLELDLLFLEIEENAENLLSEDNLDNEKENNLDIKLREEEKDEYEFESINQETFDDPLLLLNIIDNL